jgi:hypothetical protein
MMSREPFHEKIETASSRLRTNARAPARPFVNEGAETQEANDLLVASVFQESDSCPVSVEPSNCHTTSQNLAKLLVVDVIVPNMARRWHAPIVQEPAGFMNPTRARIWNYLSRS